MHRHCSKGIRLSLCGLDHPSGMSGWRGNICASSRSDGQIQCSWFIPNIVDIMGNCPLGQVEGTRDNCGSPFWQHRTCQRSRHHCGTCNICLRFEIKWLAQKAMTSYIRSLYLQHGKHLFEVMDDVALQEYSRSYGLALAPHIQLTAKKDKNARHSTASIYPDNPESRQHKRTKNYDK